jgi:sugar/nucleoside kinase (ribokinase family)
MQHKALFIGLTTIDIQYFASEYPQANTKIKTDSPPDISVGGPATNAAVAFAHFNKTADLLSVVGQNSFTDFVNADLMEQKVVLHDIGKNLPIRPVVASVVTTKNGDRTVFTHNPSNINKTNLLSELITNVNPDVILIDGFYPEIAAECVNWAKLKQIPVVADCGSWKPQYEKLLVEIDYAVCSADFCPPACSTTEHIFKFFNDINVKNIAITRGENSILYTTPNRKGYIPVEQIEPVDTLGAGDFFHGAFCHFMLIENNFETALKKAADVATISCTYKGTREWLKALK